MSQVRGALVMPEPEPKQGDDLEAAVETAIAACDGDPRAAIKALIVANKRVEYLTDLVSPGFVRGKLSFVDLP